MSVQNTITQLAAVLKDKFTPYLAPILERLFLDAQRDIDIQFEAADEEEKSTPLN